LQARALGPSGRGELAAIVAVGAYLPAIASLGLDFFVARESARGTPRTRGEALGTAGVVMMLVGIVLALIGIPLSTWLAHGRHTVHLFILILFLGLPIGMPLLLMYWWVIGAERWSLVMLARALPILLPAVVVVVLFLLHSMTVAAVATATIAGSFVALLPALRALPSLSQLRFRWTVLRSALSFGLPAWLGTLALLTNGRLDQLLMIALVSPRQLGLYAVAVASTSLTGQITLALGSPMLSRIAGGDRGIVPRAVRTTILLVMVLNVCVALAVPLVIPLVFGSRFSGAVTMSWILLAAALPLATATVLSNCLVGDGLPGVPARGEILTLLITIPGLIVMVPRFGGLGAAWVSLVAYTVDAAYQISRSRRHFGGSLALYVVPRKDDVLWIVRRLLSLFAAVLNHRTSPAT
jgi:O-antigen/teichoic acid export membrane protein